MAERTRKIRLEVRRLMVEENLSENEALSKALPGDRNRTKALKRWKANGLWPVPESEFHEGTEQPGSGPQAPDNSERQRISETELLKKVRRMLDTIEPAERPIGATAKGRKSPLQTDMIAIRIPQTLHEELKALGGLKSRHIEKAIMLYVQAMKAQGDTDA